MVHKRIGQSTSCGCFSSILLELELLEATPNGLPVTTTPQPNPNKFHKVVWSNPRTLDLIT